MDDTEDLYAYQRAELLARLQSLFETHAPWVVHGRALLDPDDIARLRQKIRQGAGFSRRERTAMTEAGFRVDALFPGR